MTHPEPEILLASVGGSLDAETERHVATCPRCSTDLETMTRTRSAGASLAADPRMGAPTRPPRGVWESIQRELGDDLDPAPLTSIPESPREGREGREPAYVAGRGCLGGRGRRPRRLRRSPGRPRRRRHPSGRTHVDAPSRWQTTSRTARSRLTGQPARESLSVELHDSDPGTGFLEVWLLDAKTGGMVSLGVLDGERGSYAVPPGLDLAAYDQVDVSREPYDGNPAHSEVSLARGQVP